MATVARLIRSMFGGVVESLAAALERLVELPRNIKQAVLVLLDMAFTSLAMWSAIALRLGHTDFPLGSMEYACAGFTVLISAFIFLRLGLYRAVIRFMGQQAIWAMIRGVSYSTMVLTAAIFLSQIQVPRSLPFLYWVISLLLIGGTRLLARAYYHHKISSVCEKVIIYGAGESGRQLLTTLSHGKQFHVVFFADDDPRLQRTVINGVQVVSPAKLERLVREHDVSQVLLALPSVAGERRRKIIHSLENLPVYVRTVPKFNDLLLGRARVGQVQDIELEDLLERAPVASHPGLIGSCITGKVVMVTGAGGSMGAHVAGVVVVRDKADLLALGLLSDRQPKFLGQRPNLLLVQVAQWKEGSRQLALPKHVQHVRLVFFPVPGGEESKTRARLVRLDARVVAGGDKGGAQFVGLGQKRAEAHGAVAHDARVGRLAAQIGLDPGIDHR